MIVSLFGLREYLALTYEARRDRVADLIALAAVPLHYVLILEGSNGEWLIFLPTLMFLLLAVRLVLTGTTSGFVYDVSSVFWGLMLTTFCVSFAVRLAVLPDEYNPVGHWAGWMFFLIILTEINDIAQALWGRKFGRHKVTPTVSPHKTWEGLLFGMATTIVAAVLLAPLLTPLGSARFFPAFFPGQWSIVAGLIIALGGFFGDVTVSAVKRDMGAKDSSRLLPGQGGMLDRIDSLSFTAPLFYHFILVLHSWKESPAAP
jgi:phosphatidate cytidylyltransferase